MLVVNIMMRSGGLDLRKLFAHVGEMSAGCAVVFALLTFQSQRVDEPLSPGLGNTYLRIVQPHPIHFSSQAKTSLPTIDADNNDKSVHERLDIGAHNGQKLRNKNCMENCIAKPMCCMALALCVFPCVLAK